MRWYLPLLTVLVWNVTASVRSEEPYRLRMTDPLLDSWRWTGMPELKGKGLRCLAEGPDKAMWFGVDLGALKYDGINWKTYAYAEGLPEPVRDFAATDDGLFCITRSTVFRLSDETWKPVYPVATGGWPWLFEDLAVDGKGSLWVATSGGALELSPGASGSCAATLYTAAEIVAAFEQNAAADELYTVVVEEGHTAEWTTGAGIYVYAPIPDGQIVIAMAADGPAAQAGLRIGDRIVAINGEDRPTLFQRELDAKPGTTLDLAVERPGEDQLLRFSLVCEELSGEFEIFRPYAIAVDHQDDLWFGTRLGRLVSFRRDGDRQIISTNHTKQHGLESVAVPSLTATADGVAAVGRSSNSRALLQFDGRSWTSRELPNALAASIIHTQDNRLLVGTNGKVLAVDENQISAIATATHGIFGNDVLLHEASDGALWIAGQGATAFRVAPQGHRWTTYDGLSFVTGTSTGEAWFLTGRHTVVRNSGDTWTEYDVSDGLMTVPMTIVTTRNGDVWAAGSHEGVAATARLKDGEWVLRQHPRLAWSIDRRAAFADSEGRVWFGAAAGSPPGLDFLGGVIRFDGEEWKHFQPAGGLTFVYGIEETGDGTMWFAGPTLMRISRDDRVQVATSVPSPFRGFVDALSVDQDDNLWLGTRDHGLMRMSPAILRPDTPKDPSPGTAPRPGFWPGVSVYGESAGVSNNRIKSVVTLRDGTLLAATFAGFDRFDGQVWLPSALPQELASDVDYSGLHATPDGSVWISETMLNRMDYEIARINPGQIQGRCRAIRLKPDGAAPDTWIAASLPESQEGDRLMVSWSGTDRWNLTVPEDLVYSYRIDQGLWSPFSSARMTELSGIAAGEHNFAVRARDTDLNVDSSPAVLQFHVLAPVWRRGWFQSILTLSAVLIAFAAVQTRRVYRRGASLRSVNDRLLNAERQLQAANAELEERVRRRTVELMDVNERLQQEIEERGTLASRLQASETEYRSVVEDQNEFVVRFDQNGIITFSNAAYARENQCQPQDMIGRSCFARVHPDDLDLVEPRLKMPVKETSIDSILLRAIRPDGSIRWVEWSGRALFDARGQVRGFQVVGRDVTELREAETRLREKEAQLAHLGRVAALGELVAGISHEINQPLATIANFSSAAQLVLKDQDLPAEDGDKLQSWLQRIAQQTTRINSIIQGLRRFGRPGRRQEFFSVGQAAREALAVMETRTRHFVDRIEVDCPDDLPPVYADRIQIEQVFVNLILNACDAMENTPLGERLLQIEARQTDCFLRVAVTDAGPGLSPDATTAIFDAFVSTKSDGMGIGLAISRSIIEAHGGNIQAISQEGGGRFEFSLPIGDDTNNEC
ncbi:MAG: PAS domain S-box protein [Fuerstiella sp.]